MNAFLCICNYVGEMGSRNISISNEAYDALSKEKEKGREL